MTNILSLCVRIMSIVCAVSSIVLTVFYLLWNVQTECAVFMHDQVLPADTSTFRRPLLYDLGRGTGLFPLFAVVAVIVQGALVFDNIWMFFGVQKHMFWANILFPLLACFCYGGLVPSMVTVIITLFAESTCSTSPWANHMLLSAVSIGSFGAIGFVVAAVIDAPLERIAKASAFSGRMIQADAISEIMFGVSAMCYAGFTVTWAYSNAWSTSNAVTLDVWHFYRPALLFSVCMFAALLLWLPFRYLYLTDTAYVATSVCVYVLLSLGISGVCGACTTFSFSALVDREMVNDGVSFPLLYKAYPPTAALLVILLMMVWTQTASQVEHKAPKPAALLPYEMAVRK